MVILKQQCIIARHSMKNKSPNGMIRLESNLRVLAGKWNKPILIDSLDLGNVHGTIFN